MTVAESLSLETKQEHVTAAVGAIQQVRRGETQLRLIVSSWLEHGWALDHLEASLAEQMDDSPKLGYLQNIATRSRIVGLLGEPSQGKRNDLEGSRMRELPVENPKRLSAALPTERAVKAFAKAPTTIKKEIVNEAMSNPGKTYTEAEIQGLLNKCGELERKNINLKNEKDELEDRLQASNPFDVDNARRLRLSRIVGHFLNGIPSWEADVKNYVHEIDFVQDSERKSVDPLLKSLAETLRAAGY
jgi:hypothetical protein